MTSHIFYAGCHSAIKMMREANMSDGHIACVLQDVRAAAIQEERLRMEKVRMDNPPQYSTLTETVEEMNQ